MRASHVIMHAGSVIDLTVRPALQTSLDTWRRDQIRTCPAFSLLHHTDALPMQPG